MNRFASLVCCAVALYTGSAVSDELRVPQDYPTLAEAVAAARPSDVIQLDEGVFEGQVILDNFSISIRGKGSALTTIVPAGADNGFPLIRWYDNGDESHTPTDRFTLEGITLSGYAAGDPNDQSSYREGLSAQGRFVGRFSMNDVRFRDMYVPNQTVCEILSMDSFEAADCVFDEVSGQEGSLYILGVEVVEVRRCAFERNGGSGSPLTFIQTDSALVENSAFIGTSSMSTSQVRSSTFFVNSSATVRNCSFGAGGPDASTPSGQAGHVGAFSSLVTLENCAFGDGQLLTLNTNSTVRFTRCIGTQLTAANGNIVASPGFSDPGDPGPDGLWRTSDDNPGDLTPAFDSPMVDAASGEPFTLIDSDLLGNQRLHDEQTVPNTGDAPRPYLDLGAIEFGAPPPCPADVNGDGNLSPTDFTAWINAFNNNLPQCDQNGDGSCTPTDFTAWIANFNAGC